MTLKEIVETVTKDMKVVDSKDSALSDRQKVYAAKRFFKKNSKS